MSGFEMTVKGQRGEYHVAETADWLHKLAAVLRPGHAILTDERLYQEHAAGLEDLGRGKVIVYYPLGGSAKTMQNAAWLLDLLAQMRFSRQDVLHVVGGGTMMDLGGFAASVYMRGIDWTYFPTTLLSQADSCIGGKTSLNLRGYKNIVGTFWPPNEVSIDRSFLLTLPDVEILSGVGEMLHFFLVAGEAHTESMLDGLLDPCRSSAFPEIVDAARRTLEIKKLYVEIDEQDRGERRKLNFGHSFAHAVEALHPDVPHGLAVALGMTMACCVSKDLGYLEPEECRRMMGLIAAVYAGRWRMPVFDVSDLMEALTHDKKRTEPGTINLILTSGPGQMFEVGVRAETLEAMLSGGLQSIIRLT